MERRIIFIGDRLSIEFFSIFNIETFFSNSSEEAEEIIKGLDMKEVICIFITEDIFDENKFLKYLNSKKMIVIPSLKKSEKTGIKILNNMIRRATGMRS